MPGRKDFGILRSSFHYDARAHRAAVLYVERGIAVDPHGFATVAGHVVQLGLWAMRETDDGVLPGDGTAAAADALRLHLPEVAPVLAALRDAGLLRADLDGLYLVGFVDCYAPILGKRLRDRSRPDRAAGRSDVGATSRDVEPVSNGHPPDDVATEPTAAGRSDVGATSRDVDGPPGTRARTRASGRAVPAVPCRSELPSPTPSLDGKGIEELRSPVATNGHARPTESDRRACGAILSIEARLPQNANLEHLTPDQRVAIERLKRFRASALADDEVRDLVVRFESKYPEACSEARLGAQRDARARRREERENANGGGP